MFRQILLYLLWGSLGSVLGGMSFLLLSMVLSGVAQLYFLLTGSPIISNIALLVFAMSGYAVAVLVRKDRVHKMKFNKPWS